MREEPRVIGLSSWQPHARPSHELEQDYLRVYEVAQTVAVRCGIVGFEQELCPLEPVVDAADIFHAPIEASQSVLPVAFPVSMTVERHFEQATKSPPHNDRQRRLRGLYPELVGVGVHTDNESYAAEHSGDEH